MRSYPTALFLFSLFLFSCSDPSSAQKPGKKAPKEPQGTLYLRTFYWAMNNTMEISWIYLTKDGNIVRDPKHGTSPLNLEQEKQDSNSQVGTYKTDGNEMQISWSGGKKEGWLVQQKNGIYTALNKGPVTVVSPVPAGFTFEKSFPASAFIPGESALHNFHFKKDGIFRFEKYGDYPSSLPGNTAGTYQVKQNTLFMQMQDGKTITANACLFNFSEQSPKKLIINREYQDL